jgi:putative tryptophan/tyrosine transport system substrate-binding protein
MDRRTFIAIVAAGLVGPARVAVAQQARATRIGWLTIEPLPDRLEAFRQGLREIGNVEAVIEESYAHGQAVRFASFVAELLQVKLDALVTIGSAAIQAARHATATLPIVFVVGDPVAAGLVASLAHPGGNLTGLAIIASELNGKRVELLKEATPHMTRLGVLRDVEAAASSSHASWQVLDTSAKKKGIRLMPALDVQGPDELDAAFAVAVKEDVDGLLIGSTPLFGAWRQQIVDLAAKNRLAVIYETGSFVEAGGLMSYGPDIAYVFHRAAAYVDKILKGAKPADLPVERPTRLELVINMKTAKALGLTIPQSPLLRADEVIQ